MSKKHFIEFAKEFKDWHKPSDSNWREGYKAAIADFCLVAEKVNPSFDRARFLIACGIDPLTGGRLVVG